MTNNIRRCFLLFVLFCCNGYTIFSTAELTEDIIVAKEEAWARRAIEDYNRGYRLRKHPLAHEIKYELPSSSGGDNLDSRVEDADQDDKSDSIVSIDATTRDDDAPVKFHLRGRGAASRQS